jgi:hypothetical protein
MDNFFSTNTMILQNIFSVKQNGFWRRISQSEIRNSAAEKNWNRKARAGKNSFPPTPFLFARPSDWILKLRIRIFLKKCSNFVQKTPPIFTFCEIVRNCLGAKRLGMIFFRNFKGIFEIKKKRAVGNAEVPVRKHRENEVFRTNLFSFAFSERLSVFFFNCPKNNLKTI